MNADTVRNMILRAKRRAGTWRALSRAWRIDVGQLHRTAMGLQTPSEAVLDHLGLEKGVTYLRK